MADWILDLIPLWAWIVIAAFAAFALWRVLGLRGALAAIGAAAALLAYRQGRKAGGADALRKQKRADDKAVKDHDRIKADTDRMSDDQLDASNDPWLRKRKQ